MGSKVHKFKEAYATMVVAVYEPLVVKWISGWGLKEMAAFNTKRKPRFGHVRTGGISGGVTFENGAAPSDTRTQPPPEEAFNEGVARRLRNRNVTDVTRDAVPGMEGGRAAGHISVPAGNRVMADFSLPTMEAMTDRADTENPSPVELERNLVFNQIQKSLIEDPEISVGEVLKVLRESNDFPLFLLPEKNVEEVLSPIGIANFYRQLYYYIDEGYGPIEQCFTVAPGESLTVVTTTSRRQIQEEILEMGSETISEQATEERNKLEVSDKVTSMLQRDLSASMSVKASYSVPVFSVEGEAKASMETSQKTSRETATTRLKDVTKRASERITKSYTLKTKTYEEYNESEQITRVIGNDSDTPVNYGLRRIFNRIKVQVQDLGPKLVWQLHVKDPGSGLRRSKFVHFMEAEEIATGLDLPPDLSPPPVGGTETGQTQVTLTNLDDDIEDDDEATAKLTIKGPSGRKITAIQIDSMRDLSEPGGKDKDRTPAPYNNVVTDGWNDTKKEFSKDIKVRPGNARSISVSYTYRWEPSKEVWEAWEEEKEAAIANANAEKRQEEFEKKKALITEQSKVKPRPANDLRKEERYEILNRMVNHLFGPSRAHPNPKEVEFFHRFFDIDALFVYHHPSWWKPRRKTLTEDDHYPITADSEPARLGKSLGWKIQLDGDDRRNEFLNSAWVRVCIPMKPGRERAAVEWLAEHVEGRTRFDIENGDLATLMTQIEKHREKEAKLGIEHQTADTISVETQKSVGAPDNPQKAEDLYPVIDDFHVTIPTEGFVYDKIEIIDDEAAT